MEKCSHVTERQNDKNAGRPTSQVENDNNN